MSTNLTRFEARLPLDSGNGTSQDQAIESFLSNLAQITPYTFINAYQVDSSNTTSQYNLVFGLLTSSQASQALSLLNTLNGSLGYSIMCYTWNVATQP